MAYLTWYMQMTWSEERSTLDPPGNGLQDLSLLITFTRHGARTPYLRLDGDPNNDFWTDGRAQLTNVGKQQLFSMGQTFRKQYGGYLSEDYIAEEILVKSTSMDRTIMSAQCFLAGLYPPNGTHIWNPDLAWQPIPVYLIDYNVDRNYDEAILKALSSCSTCNPKMSNLVYEQYKTTIMAVENSTGYRYSCLDSNFTLVLDTFALEDFYNLTVPFGLKSVWQSIINLEDIAFVKINALPEFGSIINGLLLNEVIQNLEAYRDKKQSRKVFAYFVHDANILPLLSTFTNAELKRPSFAASVTIEVHRIENSDYVTMLHRASPELSNEPVEIKDCGKLCPLDTFIDLVKSAAVQPATVPCPC